MATQETVIVKVYDRAKMKPKNFARLDREVRTRACAVRPLSTRNNGLAATCALSC